MFELCVSHIYRFTPVTTKQVNYIPDVAEGLLNELGCNRQSTNVKIFFFLIDDFLISVKHKNIRKFQPRHVFLLSNIQ